MTDRAKGAEVPTESALDAVKRRLWRNSCQSNDSTQSCISNHGINVALNEIERLEQQNATFTAECERLRDKQENYQGRLWCALGQPVNIELIQAVKQMRADNTKLREALKQPVTDEEWPCEANLEPCARATRDEINDLLTARAEKAGV